MARKSGNKATETETADYDVPKGFANLDDVRVDLAGFYSPKEDRLAPGGDHIFGTLVKYVERRSPTKRQAEGFIIVVLANTCVGLVYGEEGAQAVEGELTEGMAIGIDIRGAYKMLAEPQYEGKKVHLWFKKKRELPDGNEFWECAVQVEGGLVRMPRRGQGQSQGIPDADLPF